MLKETSKKYEQTIIMITHNRGIAQTADRVLQVSVFDRIMRNTKYGLIGIQLDSNATEETIAEIRSLENDDILSQISVKAINKIMLPIWRYELFVMVFWLLSELSRCLISSIASP